MNTGDIIFDVTKTSASSTAQRIVPESSRYRWEQQWLKENRDVSGVVHNDAKQSFTLAAKPPDLTNQAEVKLAAAPSTACDAAARSTAASFGASAAAELEHCNALAAINNTLTANPIFSMATESPHDSLYPATNAQPENSSAPATRDKSDAKQFALWRADDEIKISMRLAQSETEQSATVDTLRQWLKDLRLKLTTVIINGAVHWQVKPRDRDGY